MQKEMTQEDALGILVQVAEAAIVKGSFLSRKEIVVIDRALDMFVKQEEPTEETTQEKPEKK